MQARRVILLLVATFAAMVSVAVAAASGSSPTFDPPQQYYLSLGDSIGFGLQLDKLFDLLNAGTYTPSAFDTGYTDDLAARMKLIRPDQQVVNMSCPAESTETMINGDCPFTHAFGLTIHTSYDGAQLAAAVAFLRAHPGQVSPVTISIGANDTGMFDTCHFDPTCIQQSGAPVRLAEHLDAILGALRAAAPDTEIIVVGAYNLNKISHPSSDAVWNQFYVQVSAAAAARHQAYFANAFAAIDTRDQLCRLTFLCVNGDPHPTNAGYQALADLIFATSGYDGLH
jgi:lysophospholipase L1-like esterase